LFFKILINYILGYVNIEIEGFYIERFINMCISKKIFLWNMNRKKSSIMKVSIGIQDFKNIREIAKKTGCKVKINEKKGLPFIFNRYKKRKIFFIMLLIIFAVMYILSNFIWNIEIEGLSEIKKEDILKNLNNNGLKMGVLKNNINIKELVNNIRLEREEIAWIGIEIKGTNAKISIVEATEKPQIIKENEYCNIIANKKGIITKINALNGTPVAKVRGLGFRGECLNCRLDGRKIFRKKICSFDREHRS